MELCNKFIRWISEDKLATFTETPKVETFLHNSKDQLIRITEELEKEHFQSEFVFEKKYKMTHFQKISIAI